MNSRRFFRSFLFSLFFLSGNAFPWGDVGHETVAYIAEKNLSPAVLAKIKPLLGGQTLAEMSVLADQYTQNHQTTSVWHYINIPIRENIAVTDVPRFYTVKEVEDNNIIRQIEKEIIKLKDSETSNKDKQRNLMFLVHFMGDLSMPLHCADDNDKGGNNKPVMFFSPDSKDGRGHKTNLHSLWDNLIEVQARENPRQLADQLDKAIRSIDKQRWDAGTVQDWAFDTYTVAKEVVYPGLSAGPGTAAIGLPKDYYAKMRPSADIQLEKAGMRLAYILEEIFGE